MIAALAAALLLAQPTAPIAAVPTAVAPARWPTREGEHVINDFRFKTGEVMPALRMRYTTLGTPKRDAAGRINNAVMVLHGTGGTGRQFLSPQFADVLYGPGHPLDIRRYYVILPDNIGHGGSSKPSDGLKMKFPAYDYDDMVAAQHRLLTDGLGVRGLRLLMGTSMGCMHAFVWGETHPGFARALMPLACQPVEIAGLNRMWRQLVVDGIRGDPAWRGGDYATQPIQGLRTAASLLTIAGGAPLHLQATYPTNKAASAYVSDRVAADIATRDANDLIYQIEASRTYDPWPKLERITAPMTWINSADDFINPRGLDVPARAVGRMRDARFRLIPETQSTRGHGTHTWAVNYVDDLRALLARSEAK